MGFEPTTPVSQGNRLAGGRTRPLCDPSVVRESNGFMLYIFTISQPFSLLKSIILGPAPNKLVSHFGGIDKPIDKDYTQASTYEITLK